MNPVPWPVVVPTNAQIAELLARRAEETEGPRQRAYQRSSAAAFEWPEEAAAVLEQGRPLTELRYVGDRLAARITGWIEDPPEIPDPPPARRGFRTLTDVIRTLEEHPEYRSRLRGDLQMHTIYSDGLSTVEEMARAAAEKGYEYIAITDHSSGQRIPAGMDDMAMARQRSEINAVNLQLASEGVELRVIRSIEMNLRPDGSGALPAGCGEDFELVLGSFHSKLREKEDQTQRYVAALGNRDVDAIGHPKGRRYDIRPGLEADWDIVFAAAAHYSTAMEINANPSRQDMSVELLSIARGHEMVFTIGTDAHSIPEFDFAPFSLAAAAAAGIEPGRILNFGSCTDLLEWREARRKT